MVRKIEPPLRMTDNEASERYCDVFVLMQMDSMDLSDDVGTVLYVGDDRQELYRLMVALIGIIAALLRVLIISEVLGGLL